VPVNLNTTIQFIIYNLKAMQLASLTYYHA